MVEALSQPLLRITSAALPVKAANFTSPSTPSAMCRASVVLPVPAKPNRRNTCGVPARPGFALSQSATAFSAESWCGEKVVMVQRESALPRAARTENLAIRAHDASGSFRTYCPLLPAWDTPHVREVVGDALVAVDAGLLAREE